MTWINTDVSFPIHGVVLRVPWHFLQIYGREFPDFTIRSVVLPEAEKDVMQESVHDLLHFLTTLTDLPKDCMPYAYKRCVEYHACEIGVGHNDLPQTEGFKPFPIWNLELTGPSEWKWIPTIKT